MKLTKLFNTTDSVPQQPRLSSQFVTKNGKIIQLILTEDQLFRIVRGCPIKSAKSRKAAKLSTAIRFQIRLESDDTLPKEYNFKEKLMLWQMLLKQFLPELDYQNYYEVGKLVGSGSFASVYSAIKKDDQSKVAIKAFQKRNLYQTDPKWRVQIDNEVRVMRALNHPNLLKLYDIFENKAQVYLIIDLARGGSLESSLRKLEGPMPFLAAKVLFLQIVEGVKAMHDQGYMHRDLKPSNILFRQPMALKSYGLAVYQPNVLISDFGIASKIAQLDVYRYCGSHGYMAPEVFECEQNPQKDYDQSCDIFSLGCILYRLITNKPLFSGPSAKQANKECKLNWPEITSELYNSKPLIQLLEKMLSPNPKERPSCDQILTSKILQVQFTQEGAPVFKDFNKPRMKTMQVTVPLQRGSMQQLLKRQVKRLPPLKKMVTSI